MLVQVLAASLGYGDEAAEVATVTKLLRNAFIGPITIAVAILWTRRETAKNAGTRGLGLSTVFPPFVVGFLAVAALRSAGVIDATLANSLSVLASFSILVALAGIGVSTRLGALRSAGGQSVLLGVMIVLALSGITLLLVLMGIG